MDRLRTALPLLPRTHSRPPSHEYKNSPMPARTHSRQLSQERQTPFAPSSNEGKTSKFRRNHGKKSEDKRISSQSKLYDTADSTLKSIKKQPLEEINVEELTGIFYDIILKACTKDCDFDAFPSLSPSDSPSTTEISERLAANTQHLLSQMAQFAALPDPELHS